MARRARNRPAAAVASRQDVRARIIEALAGAERGFVILRMPDGELVQGEFNTSLDLFAQAHLAALRAMQSMAGLPERDGAGGGDG